MGEPQRNLVELIDAKSSGLGGDKRICVMDVQRKLMDRKPPTRPIRSTEQSSLGPSFPEAAAYKENAKKVNDHIDLSPTTPSLRRCVHLFRL